MSALAKLLGERGVAETKHTQAIRALSVARQSLVPNRRTIVNGINLVEQTYDVLVEKHVNYAIQARTGLEDPVNVTYINARTDTNNTELEEARA